MTAFGNKMLSSLIRLIRRKNKMTLQAHDRGVVNITPQQLQEYVANNPEENYMLIDVRQPSEYSEQHIAGAKLMPLGEVLNDGPLCEEVKSTKEPFIIFSCRSGGRSSRAASYFANQLGMPNVFNLKGGMLGWDGPRMQGMPTVGELARTNAGKQVLERVLGARKASFNLYSELVKELEGKTEKQLALDLAKAEKQTARDLYGCLHGLCGQPVDGFEDAFAAVPAGEMIDGTPFSEALNEAKEALTQGTRALQTWCYANNLAAYDVFRHLYNSAKSDTAREIYIALAERQKQHCLALQRTQA